MAQSPQEKPKHMKSFWPLVIIFVFSVIVAGVIFWFQFSLSMDYEIGSLEINIHKRQDSLTKKSAPNATTTNKVIAE